MIGRVLTLGLVAAAVLAAALLWWPDQEGRPSTGGATAPWRLLDDGSGFARVGFPHELSFPADHGPHGEFRTEWWNLTGTLEDAQGQHLGLQLALVRLGLVADPPERASRWAARDVYAGSFSLSNPGGGLSTAERISRGAAGLAGADAKPRRVWIEDWRVEEDGESALTLEVGSIEEELSLRLKLRGQKALVRQNAVGDRDPDQDPPFHFYLQPRMRAEGTLRDAGREVAVTGTVSLEHAWGELPLPGGPVALDRFTLHLDDGRDLLLSRTHRVDGGGNPRTTALLVDESGKARTLGADDVSLDPTDYWDGDRTGARYPVRWSLRIPKAGIELALSPYRQDQAGATWLPFWAGAVRIDRPSSPGDPLGSGFVQLTGYETNE